MLGFGRLQSFDLRDLGHLMSDTLDPPGGDYGPDPSVNNYWAKHPTVLNQGPYPQCVAYAGKHWMIGGPVMSRPEADPQPARLYELAQARDGFPLPHDGTTVRAMMGVLKDHGYFTEYVWAMSEPEILGWVQHISPVIIGIPWKTGMMEPDPEGWIEPTGIDEGGHSVELRGFSARRQAYRLLNSWGELWGQKGMCWLHRDALAELLADWGEAVGMREIRTVWAELAGTGTRTYP